MADRGGTAVLQKDMNTRAGEFRGSAGTWHEGSPPLASEKRDDGGSATRGGDSPGTTDWELARAMHTTLAPTGAYSQDPEAGTERKAQATANKAAESAAAAAAAASLAPKVPDDSDLSTTERWRRAQEHSIDAGKLAQLRSKMKAASYGMGGQDPRRVLRKFDKDSSGELELAEFAKAIRTGGHLTKKDVSDADIKHMFDALDMDGSGHVGIDELTDLVWQTSYSISAQLAQQEQEDEARRAEEDAAFLADEKEAAEAAALAELEPHAKQLASLEPEPESEPEFEPGLSGGTGVLGAFTRADAEELTKARLDISELREANQDLEHGLERAAEAVEQIWSSSAPDSEADGSLHAEDEELRSQLAGVEEQLGERILASTAQKMVTELDARATSGKYTSNPHTATLSDVFERLPVAAAEKALAALRTEAAELRAANVAFQRTKSEEQAANSVLVESNSALIESVSKLEGANRQLRQQVASKEDVERKLTEVEAALEERNSTAFKPHAGVGRPEWVEREYLSEADEQLTFDITCKVLDDMRTEVVGSRAVQGELEQQVAELTAEMDALKMKVSAAEKIADYNAQGAELGLPPVSAAMNVSAAATAAPAAQRSIQGTVDLRDEVMAVAEQLLERSQSMAFSSEVARSPPRRSYSGEDQPSVSGSLSEITAALEAGERASVSVTTSRVSPRTRTELMHSAMAQREVLDGKRRAAEADQKRREDERRGDEQRERGEDERRQREAEARLRREKVRHDDSPVREI